MKLKKNIGTLLLGLIFLAGMGLSCYQMGYITITRAVNPNSTGGLIIFGTIMILIASYFVKEGNYLGFFEKNNMIPIITEGFVVLLAVACMWLVLQPKNMSVGALCIGILLLSYLAARLIGGRLNGMITVICTCFFTGSFMISDVSENHQIEILMFLISFCLFIVVTKYLARFTKNTALMLLVYFVTAIVFAISAIMNPAVYILALACVLSLLSGKVGKYAGERKSVPLASGFFCGILFFLFFLLAVVGASTIFSMSNGLDFLGSLQLPIGKLDAMFSGGLDLDVITSGILEKSNMLTDLVYIPFEYGAFPTLVLFFALLSGIHVLRKEDSYISPMVVFYGVAFVLYLLFAKKGADFTYLYYLSPIMAGYGLITFFIPDTNTEFDEAIIEEPLETEDKKEEIVSPKPEQIKETVPEPKPEVKEAVKKEEKSEEPPKIAEPESVIEPESLAATKEPEMAMSESNYPEWTLSPDVAMELEEPFAADMSQNSVLVEPATIGDVEEQPEHHMEQFLTTDMLTSDEEENVALSVEKEPDLTEIRTEDISDPQPEDGADLNVLLDRLELTENIRRMNASAQEDMAEVIENTLKNKELEQAVPVEDMKVVEKEDGQYVAEDLQFEEENITSQPETPIEPKLESQLELQTEPQPESVVSKNAAAKLDSLILPEMDETEMFPEFNGEAEMVTIDELTADTFSWQEKPTDEPKVDTSESLKSESFEQEIPESKIPNAEDRKETKKEVKHSEEAFTWIDEPVVKKTAVGKRTYHRMVIK